MFDIINKEILSKNNLDEIFSENNLDEIFSEKFLLEYQIYLFVGESELRPNKIWPKTPLSNDSKSEELEDNTSKLFSREDNQVLSSLKCLEESKESEESEESEESKKSKNFCGTCKNCNLRIRTSRFPFMIIRNGKEFTLIDVARNFDLIDCKSNKKLETNTKLEIYRTYTINYGTSTIVFQIIKE